MLFDVYCPRHEARVMLGRHGITGLRNTPHGIVVHWRCTCGETGTLRTGALAQPIA